MLAFPERERSDRVCGPASPPGRDLELPRHSGGTGLPSFDATTGCALFKSASTRTHVLGHDGSYSIALPDLWFLGDTFLGRWKADGTRDVTGSERNASALVSPTDLGTCFENAVYPGDPLQEALVRPETEEVSRVAAWTGDAVRSGDGHRLRRPRGDETFRALARSFS